jgi:hypothetical protein
MSVTVQAQGDGINKGPSVPLSGKDLDGNQQRYPRSAAEHCQGQEAMGGDVMDFGLKAYSAEDLCLFLQGSGDECASVQLLYSSEILWKVTEQTVVDIRTGEVPQQGA